MTRYAPRRRTVSAVALVAVGLATAGCGYQQSGSSSNAPAGYQWSSLYRGDVRTVAVPIFGNRTYYRGLEFNLTKAVANQLEMRSPYKIVPRERADTVLEAEVVKVRLRTLSEGTGAVPQEQLFSVGVNFVWRDLRTGAILVQRKEFEQAATWYARLGEGQFYAQQADVERLAMAIVQEMEAPW
jgi:hypothetical protein